MDGILLATFCLIILFFVAVFWTTDKFAKIQATPRDHAERLLDAFKMIKSVEYTHGENGADYYIRRDGERLFICFQGSHGFEDWINNFDFFAKPYKEMTATWRVHRGFLRVWKAVEDIIGENISDPSISHIEIYGYSHGGALAQFCHEYCMYHRPGCSVRTYAFGAPRVLWGIVPASVKRRFSGLFVIRNGLDIVPHLPFVVMGFRHVGEIEDVGLDLHPTKSHLRYRQVIEDILAGE